MGDEDDLSTPAEIISLYLYDYYLGKLEQKWEMKTTSQPLQRNYLAVLSSKFF